METHSKCINKAFPPKWVVILKKKFTKLIKLMSNQENGPFSKVNEILCEKII